jgi:hypothetical protein
MNNKAEKEDSKQYTITLNERQLKALAYACRVTDWHVVLHAV